VISSLAVDDGLGECASVDADDRRAAGVGLQRDEPLGLDGAREGEHVE
jgi:hypothetical protein